MSIISKSELLVGRQVVVLNLDWTQRWVEPQQLWLDVYWRLESSTAVWIMLGPAVLSFWPCNSIDLNYSKLSLP